MKKLLMILLLTVLVKAVEAQTFAEWVKQNKTQKKYLLQQIAALQIYIDYAQKGYSIARSGLNSISSIKKGNVILHTNFLNSFKAVNPNIRNYRKVLELILIQQQILEVYKRDYKSSHQSRAFNAQEVAYINRVYNRVMEGCSGIINRLIIVTTANAVEMKDDERLKSIDALYMDMLDNYKFIKSFGDDNRLLVHARLTEKSDVQKSEVLNGVR